VAYNDDFRFNPDPLILFSVPRDGDYVVAINDAIFRGREDFVYRMTVDESPLVTSIFPLGAQAGTSPAIAMQGWNLEGALLYPPPEDAKPGIHFIRATKGARQSNAVPFALSTLPDCLDQEPNNAPDHAQKIERPIIINGRIDRPNDWDVFQFTGRRGETIVADVMARRLNSPLDSVLKLTDARGTLLAVNDDCEDLEAGTNTHYADAYLTFKLPADGTYYVHLGDIARAGGEEYAYRLRIGEPEPDFALRVMPSSVLLRKGGSNTVTVFIDRKDGFADPVTLSLKDPPPGISAGGAVIAGSEPVAKLTIRADSGVKPGLFDLTVEGRWQMDSYEVVREAVPAEDRMQAFLWRHLVPAQDLKAIVPDPSSDSSSRPRAKPVAKAPAKPAEGGAQPKFDRSQVAGAVQRVTRLYEEGLLSEEFYRAKLAEYEKGL